MKNYLTNYIYTYKKLICNFNTIYKLTTCIYAITFLINIQDYFNQTSSYSILPNIVKLTTAYRKEVVNTNYKPAGR